MTGTIATYAATARPGLNKAKVLATDDTGYSRCILGGFDVTNTSGIAYPITDAIRKMFAPGGILRRRLDKGVCRGEYEHPVIDGMPHHLALKRLSVLDPDRISHHFKSMELVESKDESGTPIVLVYGMVRTCGAKGEILQRSFDNPEENIYFSIRSFTDQNMVRGVLTRRVKSLLTYDYVNEGGIAQANRFDTVGMESDICFTVDDFNRLETDTDVGLESGSLLTMVKDDFGWNRVAVSKLSALMW